jgi:hypothetical protein
VAAIAQPIHLRRTPAQRHNRGICRARLIPRSEAIVMPSSRPRSSRETIWRVPPERAATSSCRRFREMRTSRTIRPICTSSLIWAGWHPGLGRGLSTLAADDLGLSRPIAAERPARARMIRANIGGAPLRPPSARPRPRRPSEVPR